MKFFIPTMLVLLSTPAFSIEFSRCVHQYTYQGKPDGYRPDLAINNTSSQDNKKTALCSVQINQILRNSKNMCRRVDDDQPYIEQVLSMESAFQSVYMSSAEPTESKKYIVFYHRDETQQLYQQENFKISGVYPPIPRPANILFVCMESENTSWMNDNTVQSTSISYEKLMPGCSA